MFVIVRDIPSGPSKGLTFYTGSGWSSEYPEAKQYRTDHRAWVMSNKAMTELALKGDRIDCISIRSNYGQDDETLCFCQPDWELIALANKNTKR